MKQTEAGECSECGRVTTLAALKLTSACFGTDLGTRDFVKVTVWGDEAKVVLGFGAEKAVGLDDAVADAHRTAEQLAVADRVGLKFDIGIDARVVGEGSEKRVWLSAYKVRLSGKGTVPHECSARVLGVWCVNCF